MATTVFLGLSVLVWLPYGLYCLVNPGYLAQVADVASSSATGTTELRAMYGGLQAAMGVLAGLALVRRELRPHALLAMTVLPAGLFLGRLVGVVLDGRVSGYTGGALAFELLLVVIAGWLFRGQATGRALTT